MEVSTVTTRSRVFIAAAVSRKSVEQLTALASAGAWGIDKAQNFLLRSLANGRLSLAGLVTHTITPEQLGDAYEGLLKDKDNYLGVLVKWV